MTETAPEYTIPTEALIANLVREYRDIKIDADIALSEMKQVKSELEPLLEMLGEKWTDDDGYAQIVERGPTVSYKGSEIDKLATAWAESSDPVMQSCGRMLQMHRTERPGSRYVRVS